MKKQVNDLMHSVEKHLETVHRDVKKHTKQTINYLKKEEADEKIAQQTVFDSFELGTLMATPLAATRRNMQKYFEVSTFHFII